MDLDGAWALPFTSHLAEVKVHAKRITARCPICGATISMAPSKGLIAFHCFGDPSCANDAILAKVDLTLDDLKIREQPAAAHTNNGNNGHHHQNNGSSDNGQVVKRPPTLKEWEAQLFYFAEQMLRNDPEYRDKPVPAELLLEPLRADLKQGIALMAQRGSPPPDGLSEIDLNESIDHLSKLAIEAWANRPMSNGAVDEPAIELPSVIPTTVVSTDWQSMQERRAARHYEWVVEGKAAKREVSSWAGKVEGGKTTLMRELTMCVIRGEKFLGFPTIKGRVYYAMLDADGEDATYEAFEELGFDDEDARNCRFLFSPMLASIEHGFELFIKDLLAFKPDLVIIDPYPRLKIIEDFHSYTNTYLMAQLSGLATMLNAHLALPGHIPRGRNDDDDVATAGFGSVAFTAGVNARFVITNRTKAGVHTIRSSKGKGAGFIPLDAERILELDPKGRITLGAPYSWRDQAAALKTELRRFLDDHNEMCFDGPALARELSVKKSIVLAAGNGLFGAQQIRRGGEGVKNDPYIYASLTFRGELIKS